MILQEPYVIESAVADSIDTQRCIGSWTRFFDLYSGGSPKLGRYDAIYVQLPREEAISFFFDKFGLQHSNVTCDCCGQDYSVTEYPSLEEACSYQIECASWRGKVSLENYLQSKHVLVVLVNAGSASRIDDV